MKTNSTIIQHTLLILLLILAVSCKNSDEKTALNSDPSKELSLDEKLALQAEKLQQEENQKTLDEAANAEKSAAEKAAAEAAARESEAQRIAAESRAEADRLAAAEATKKAEAAAKAKAAAEAAAKKAEAERKRAADALAAEQKCKCGAKKFRSRSDHTWVEFRLPGGSKDGLVIQIPSGAHNKYVFPKCNRVHWSDLTFKCKCGTWKKTKGDWDADALCHGSKGNSPYVFVGSH